jgi:hypothetical protein
MFYRNEITEASLKSSRIHYPWHLLEEYQPDGGMWAIPSTGEREEFVEATSDLMADPAAFEAAMLRALDEWPLSVSVALTTPGLNQRAWMGHAGCFLATGSPEETTRLGWHDLDEREQHHANAAADRVIAEWRRRDGGRLENVVPVDVYPQLAFGGDDVA